MDTKPAVTASSMLWLVPLLMRCLKQLCIYIIIQSKKWASFPIPLQCGLQTPFLAFKQANQEHGPRT